MSSGYDSILPSRTSGSMMFCSFIKHTKLYKIVGAILLLLFVVPMMAHYYLSGVSIVYYIYRPPLYDMFDG